MKSTHSPTHRVRRPPFAALLLVLVAPAFAKIDTFTIRHISGACSDTPFTTGHFIWNNRHRIQIATGERISIYLHGEFADWAQDVTGADIFEWIEKKGATDNYPGSNGHDKGYVDINVRAEDSHGTGNRTITVKWATGNETISLKIVPNCAALADAPYRNPPPPPAQESPTVRPIAPIGPSPTAVVNNFPNLLPAVQAPYVLARPLAAAIATTRGAMFPVNTFFCANAQPNEPTNVAVPSLSWGVSGANLGGATAGFIVQIVNDANPAAPVLLDTLTLPNGLAASSPVAQRSNYAGRPTTLNVIRDPRFVISTSTQQTMPGCFTTPGVTQPMEPFALRVIVDASGTVAEGGFENDNSLRLQ